MTDDLIFFFGFSLIDWSGYFALVLVMFRFLRKRYMAYVIFTILFLIQFSYIMRDIVKIPMITPFMQLILISLILWGIFRIPAVFAATMASFGYVGYLLISSLALLIFEWTGLYSVEEMFASRKLFAIPVCITVITIFLICWLLHRNRLGFSIIIEDEPIKLSRNGIIKLILINIASAISVFLHIYSAFHGFFFWLFLLTSTATISLLYVLLKAEVEIYSKSRQWHRQRIMDQGDLNI
jgi:hypothetical protein